MNTVKAGKVSLNYFVITLFVIFSALPFYWMLIAAFKSDPEFVKAQTNSPFSYALPPTTKNFELLFYQTKYPYFVVNSIVVGIVVVIITVVLAVPAAYSLARLTGRWGERLGILIFMVYLIPPTLLFIPMSRIITVLGLRDSIASLIVVYPTFTVPFCTWLLMGFMKSIPRDVEEQAMVDGYSRFGAIMRVVFPLAVPGILTIIVFAFTLTMNEYIYALAFITQSTNKVIGPGVTTELIRGDVVFWQAIMAAGVLVAIPVAIVYNLFLDRFISGFTLGLSKAKTGASNCSTHGALPSKRAVRR
ncbi:MAG: carbohydrate ABC transporter permease [Anaerolineae bacterium]